MTLKILTCFYSLHSNDILMAGLFERFRFHHSSMQAFKAALKKTLKHICVQQEQASTLSSCTCCTDQANTPGYAEQAFLPSFRNTCPTSEWNSRADPAPHFPHRLDGSQNVHRQEGTCLLQMAALALILKQQQAVQEVIAYPLNQKLRRKCQDGGVTAAPHCSSHRSKFNGRGKKTEPQHLFSMPEFYP